jgi:hypothetical protein
MSVKADVKKINAVYEKQAEQDLEQAIAASLKEEEDLEQAIAASLKEEEEDLKKNNGSINT